MRIITAGNPFLDIDAYGGIIAYAELLRLQGQEAQAVSESPLNASISPIVRSWDSTSHLKRKYTPDPDDTFTLIDISEPDYFANFVDLARVTEIIDHHPGFEATWEHLHQNAHIEFVGAACTLVYERWQASGQLSQISQLSARLLMCGILDNTLNLGAAITTERDRQAYAELSRHADLPKDWPAVYFADCQAFIEQDLKAAIRDDFKRVKYPSAREFGAAQLAVWDGSKLLAEQLPVIRNVLKEQKPWFLNLISIKDGRSWFYSEDAEAQAMLSSLLGVTFTDNHAQADRFWLRKEIMKQSIEEGNL